MKKPKLTPNSKYRQGIFNPKCPEKYIGDSNEPLIYRSGLELRFMKYFDDNPAIVQWASEELAIPYISPLDGQPHRYFPDFMIKFRDVNGKLHSMMIEIKPFKETVMPLKGKKQQRTFLNEMMTYQINQAKWAYAREFCKKHDMAFEVMTEQTIKIR